MEGVRGLGCFRKVWGVLCLGVLDVWRFLKSLMCVVDAEGVTVAFVLL